MTRTVTTTREEYEQLYTEIKKDIHFNFHHRAKSSGYVGLQKVYIENYLGQYGSGYIVHLPTVQSFNIEKYKTKNVHDIEYWIRRVE